jgi:hypothetical protein
MQRSASQPLSAAPPGPAADIPKQPPMLDEAPWEPDPGFRFLYIRVNQQGECVISGPPDQVAQIKRQLFDLLSEDRSDEIPDDVQRFEIRG